MLAMDAFLGVHVPTVMTSYTMGVRHSDVAAYRGDLPDFSVKPVRTNVFDEVDPEWLLTAPDQQQVSFQSFKGKVLFLSRWATWCGPCIAEMPDVAELRDGLPEGDVEFMLYTQEQEYEVRGFENTYDLPIYNSVGQLPHYLNVSSLPQTFLVDKEGVVRYIHGGTASWGDRSVKAFMKQLISE